jgi:hypothetical protein
MFLEGRSHRGIGRIVMGDIGQRDGAQLGSEAGTTRTIFMDASLLLV